MKDDLFIFAGEASGDLLGAKLLHALSPYSLSICGVFGPKMRTFGYSLIKKTEDFEVMGFFDVLFALPKLIFYFFSLRNIILKKNPKACIFIDYPDFTLLLERSLRKKGYTGKIIHYVCPSIWAWRKKRIHTMEKNIDLLLTLFPFEKKCFSASSLLVHYTGHPLASKKQKETKIVSKKWLTIFPGSRKKEIQKNLPLQLKVLSVICKQSPYSLAISVANPHLKDLIQNISSPYQDLLKEKILLFSSSKKEMIMQQTFLAIATSGTINLELALFQIPTIVIYKISPLDLFLAKNILNIRLSFYCIVNIIANESIFPELYGPHCTEKNLLFWVQEILNKKNLRNQMMQRCQKIRALLYKKSPSKEAARKIFDLLKTL